MNILSKIVFYIIALCGIALTVLCAYCMTINSEFFFFFILFLICTIINICGLYHHD